MEGHTPRRFQGMGTRLFAGDNLNPRFPDGDAGCEFATSPSGPFQRGLAETLQRSLNDSYPLAQFRLLLGWAGNGDGIPDMVAFFISNSNTNQTGIFELEVTMEPGY